MPTFDIAWNRTRLTWSRRCESWQLEAVLCERLLLEGRPQTRIVGRLAGIVEDEIENPAHRDKFWHDAMRKLGKLRRLTVADIWKIEIMLAKRIAKPMPVPPQPSTVRPSANPVTGPHQPLRGQALRAR
jgi:hypothetical protein